MKGIEYLYILLLLDFNSTMQARVAHESSDIKRISLVSWIQLQKIYVIWTIHYSSLWT